VPVRLEPPRLAEAMAWQGALISSTSRLLLPVDELSWAPHGAGGDGGEAHRERVWAEQDPLVRRLEAAVIEHVLRESEPLPLERHQAAA
jgi:hypothetical protein